MTTTTTAARIKKNAVIRGDVLTFAEYRELRDSCMAFYATRTDFVNGAIRFRFPDDSSIEIGNDGAVATGEELDEVSSAGTF